MGSINTTDVPTLANLAKQIDPKGDQMIVVDVLSETNAILDILPFQEANGRTYHKVVRSASEPAGTFRGYNEGVGKESGKDQEALEPLAMLDSISEADVALVKTAPDPQVFRMNHARKFIRGMSKTLAATYIYGDADKTPQKFTGLAPRMDTIDSEFVFGAGGTGSDVTSIYVVIPGIDKVYGVFPHGAGFVGIEHEDRGTEMVFDSGGSKKFRAYVDYFSAQQGLVVEDPRCIGRIANIETSGTSNIFDEDLLIELLNNMPAEGEGAVILLNKTIKTQAEIRLKDKNNVNWSVEEGLGGRKFMMFRGQVVRIVDQILNTEDAIS